MKIACIIHSLDGGGAERVMAGLCDRLSGRGHEVVLITLDNGSSRHQISDQVRRVPLDLMRESRGLTDRLGNTRRRISAIRSVLDAEHPDVVLSFCDKTNITVLSATMGMAIPVVASERSDPAQQNLGKIWETARRFGYPRARRLIALTPTSAARLQPLNRRPVAVIPSAVQTPPMESDRDAADQNRLILSIGRLEPEKGFDRLIQAFAEFQRHQTDWSLRILGEGSQRPQLEHLIQEHDLSSVSLPGWISPVWPELNLASIFVLPSRYEGFPSALLEAMAMGVPCVAADCNSGPRFIIRNGEDGLLVESSVAGLIDGMTRLAKDAELRKVLGRAGQSVRDRFSWDAMVDAYEQVLREAASATDVSGQVK